MNLATIMQRIEQGDREAFATLYARYNQTVYTIAFKQTGSSEEAVHIVKAVFKEMYQTIREKGPYIGDLYAWLDQLTDKHLRLAWHRREQEAINLRQRMAPPPMSAAPQPAAGAPPQAPPPVQQAFIKAPAASQAAYAPGVYIPPAASQPRQYTNEEARALEERVDARLFPEKEEKEKKKEKSSAPSFIALSLFAVLLLWILIGLLSTLGILPEWDIGYQWFNETFFRLF